jgi:hypothetical protein
MITIVSTKLAPLVGALLVISAFQANTSGDSPWTVLWRITLSAGLGIIVGMAGVIYKAVNIRITELETLAKTGVTRPEFDLLMRRFDRLEDLLTKRGR